jgi:hypothetical protein
MLVKGTLKLCSLIVQKEETMQEQISNASAPRTTSAPPVKLWTPGFIAGVTFLLGFPAGIVIASLNWMRMKRNEKAIGHLIGGAIGIFVFVLILLLAPGNLGRLLALAVNLGTLFYLQREMRKDTEFFQASNPIEKAGEGAGCLISLGVMLLFVLFAFALAFVLVLLGVPIPN